MKRSKSLNGVEEETVGQQHIMSCERRSNREKKKDDRNASTMS